MNTNEDVFLCSATTEQIVDELASRAIGIVLGMVVNAQGVNGSKEEDFMAYRRGGMTLAIGIAERMRALFTGDEGEDVDLEDLS